ncbi:MAG TPA: winged helix DNA-binding domain-containing protein [Candidatus Limnocylindrales bacterium]|nr:winged helix DNA-binding domain-containing protein [Candidatus Limnocylindrales bacterium]
MSARASTGEVLSRRTLNRTLLARQSLLERVDRPALDVVEHLVGMQAQEPIDPYVGLWTRIDSFDPLELSAAIEGRRAVRMGHLRGTLHLVTAADALAQYPILADVMARSWKSSPFIKQLVGVDIDAVLARARELLEARPMTPSELGAALSPEWPDRDAPSLAYASRFLLPLVQVPPRALWGRTGRPTNTTAESWLGAPMAAEPSIDDLVLRYLAVFGPATVADIRVWSWLTGLREVVDRLRPRLRTFRDEAGRELFDVADGLIADEDLPAPIRFLPQYDNVFLSHDDRSRILVRGVKVEDLVWKGGVLIDGYVGAAWRIRREKKAATMTVTHHVPVTPQQRADIEAEGEGLLSFLAADADPREIRLVVGSSDSSRSASTADA